MSENPSPPADKEQPPGFRLHQVHKPAPVHSALHVPLPHMEGVHAAIGGGGELIAAADARALQQYHMGADHSGGGGGGVSGGHHVIEDEQDGAGAGAGESDEMESEGPSNPANLGDGLSIPLQISGNQLTLSFQGEVYVFDSVPPEKVQAVLLLLGGREVSTALSQLQQPTMQDKRVNISHRLASLMRFREKRKERNFNKKIRYTVRKEVALRMQRNKGQFISAKSRTEDSISGAITSDASQSWNLPDNQLSPAAACHHCGISARYTPMMRRGPDGPRTLCNACGLVWSNKGAMRDLSKNPTPTISNAFLDSREVNDSTEAGITHSQAANGDDAS